MESRVGITSGFGNRRTALTTDLPLKPAFPQHLRYVQARFIHAHLQPPASAFQAVCIIHCIKPRHLTQHLAPTREAPNLGQAEVILGAVSTLGVSITAALLIKHPSELYVLLSTLFPVLSQQRHLRSAHRIPANRAVRALVERIELRDILGRELEVMDICVGVDARRGGTLREGNVSIHASVRTQT